LWCSGRPFMTNRTADHFSYFLLQNPPNAIQMSIYISTVNFSTPPPPAHTNLMYLMKCNVLGLTGKSCWGGKIKTRQPFTVNYVSCVQYTVHDRNVLFLKSESQKKDFQEIKVPLCNGFPNTTMFLYLFTRKKTFLPKKCVGLSL
jgi:hypothetical protein